LGGTREYANRAASQNHLKQIVLGAHNYHEAHDSKSPPGYTTDAYGRPLHGWQAHLLAHLEQENAFRSIRFDKPWDDETNRKVVQMEFYLYQSPRIGATYDAAGYALSDYAGNVRAFPANRGLSLKTDFPDGTANTLMFGEVSAGIRPWGYPLNLRDPAKGLRRSAETFGGPWADGMTQFALVDGSVRKISPTISSAVLKALSTPAGGEQIDPKDW
jgi:hypothetical protein